MTAQRLELSLISSATEIVAALERLMRYWAIARCDFREFQSRPVCTQRD